MLTTRLALLALLALVAALAAGEETTASGGGGEEEEGDYAPFALEVRHADGRTCAAALVSVRTALSSAACARPALGGDVWAVATTAPAGGGAGAPRAARVLRIAYAADDDRDEVGGAGDPAADPWAGAAADLALLELAAPPAGALAILMATEAGACAAPARCHVARTAAARARVLDAELAPGATCAARGPRWPALRARTLCLAGPDLCQSDWGSGVVCAGKLCGVVSRSAGDGGDGGRCGHVHAAPSVPRWRRFLHCANTRGACGRGDCARLCAETWLADAPPTATAPLAPSPTAELAAVPGRTARIGAAGESLASSSESHRFVSLERDGSSFRSIVPENAAATGPTRTAPSAAPAAPPAAAADAGAAPPPASSDFEPNRADFRMSPASSTRVFLKAGEYGDNAAEYAAPEERPAPPAAAAPAPARTPAPPAAPARTPAAPAAQVSAAPRRPATGGARPGPRPLSLFLSLVYSYICYVI